VTNLGKAGMALLWAALSTGGLQAALWDTGLGAAGGNSGLCDSGPGSCGNATTPLPQASVIFDNFRVTAPGWIINGFDFTDYFHLVPDPTTAYKSTAWSIWNGDPLSGGSIVAQGVATFGTNASLLSVAGPACSNSTDCIRTIQVTGLSVSLGVGQYFLGTTNDVSGFVTERALSSGGKDSVTCTLGAACNPTPLGGWEQARNTGAAWSGLIAGSAPTATDTAFDIQGVLTPEPATWGLMTLALAGLAVLRRRKA
jgi:hypothetical protein